MNIYKRNAERGNQVKEDGTRDVETNWWPLVNEPFAVSTRFDIAVSQLTTIPRGTRGTLRRFGRTFGHVEFKRYGLRELALDTLTGSQQGQGRPEVAA